MRIERKRSGKTLATRLVDGELVGPPEFDGYHVLLRARDKESREVRVFLERHEAVRVAQFIRAELEEQRARVDAAVKVAEQVLG